MTPVGVTGAGPHGADGIPNRPETPQTSGLVIRLGGYFDFSMANVTDSADNAYFRNNNQLAVPSANTTTGAISASSTAITNAKSRQRSDFRNDMELNVYVDGIAANGMRYGAVLELQSDNVATGVNTLGTSSGSTAAGNHGGTAVDFDEMYGFVKGTWGELRFGQEDSAASLMQVRRPSILAMGSDDHWDEFATNPAGLANTYAPYLMSGINDGNDATKIIYLSPQFSGLDFGFSFSPNRNEGETQWTGNSTWNWQRDFTGLTNEISAALRYRGTFGPVGVQTSLVGQWASAGRQAATGAPVVVRQQNVDAYSAGLQLAAYGFKVGGEYTWGKYQGQAPAGGALNKGLDGSSHWLVSGVYETGPMAFNVMYGSGTQDNGTSTAGAKLEDRTQTYFGIGATYTIAPGMVAFINWNQIEDKNIPTAAASVQSQGSTTKAPGAAGTTLAKFGPSNTTRDIQMAIAGVRVSF